MTRSGTAPIAGIFSAAGGEFAAGVDRMMVQSIEQVAAVDTKVIEPVGVVLEKRAQRDALSPGRANFGHQPPEGAKGVERDGGHGRPLARKRISHESSP